MCTRPSSTLPQLACLSLSLGRDRVHARAGFLFSSSLPELIATRMGRLRALELLWAFDPDEPSVLFSRVLRFVEETPAAYFLAASTPMILFQTPLSSHSLSLRHAVTSSPYCFGRS